MVVPTVLGVNLEATPRENPTSKQRDQLIVGNALSLRALRESRVVRAIARNVLLDESLQELRIVAGGDARTRPDRVKKTRAPDLETGEPTRLAHDHEPRGEAFRTWFSAAQVSRCAGHG